MARLLESSTLLGWMAIGLLLHPVAVRGQETVTLRLEPQPGPVLYWIRNQELQEREWPGGEVRPVVYDHLELVSQATTSQPGGTLEVTVDFKGKEFVVNDQRVNPDIFAPRRFEYIMDSRGARADPRAAAELSAQLAPVLPEGPVKLGHSWKVETSPTREFPFEIPVTHTVVRKEEVLGLVCAIVQSRGETRGEDPATGILVESWLEAELAISLDAGRIVKSSSRLHLAMEYPRPASDGHQSMRRQVVRVVQEKRDGDVPPLGPGPASREDGDR